MAYTDDWESLMNGVFGAGGRVKFGSGAAQPDTKAKTGGLPDLNAALLEQQKQLDELLKKAECPAEKAGCRHPDGAGKQPSDAAGHGE